MNLLAMAKRLGRGRFQNPAVRGALAALETLDRVILKTAPRLSRYCGEVVVVARSSPARKQGVSAYPSAAVASSVSIYSVTSRNFPPPSRNTKQYLLL